MYNKCWNKGPLDRIHQLHTQMALNNVCNILFPFMESLFFLITQYHIVIYCCTLERIQWERRSQYFHQRFQTHRKSIFDIKFGEYLMYIRKI